MLRRFLTQRKHPRYYTLERTFIQVNPYNPQRKKSKKFKILDISDKGCAFIYNGMQQELKESGEISLILGDTPYLERIDFITISDIPFTKTGNDSGRLRRRSVAFKRLDIMKQKKLREFIAKNAIARAS